MTTYHLHLVSDSTGETVSSVARSVMVQFDAVEVEEHFWALIRTKHQVEKVIEGLKKHRGFVLYTIADPELRGYLAQQCQLLNVPCLSVLSRIVSDLSVFFGVKPTGQVGRQYELTEEYFSRVEAINFALTHDDGQSVWDLEEAEIIIVGVSRSSKSPTSMYLAFRGFRAANVPYVPGVALPDTLKILKNPLIVGLTVHPEMLVQIRKNRLLSLNEDRAGIYTNLEEVEQEVLEARKYFSKYNWPVIDVTRRSVEETAAKIIQMYQEKKKESREIMEFKKAAVVGFPVYHSLSPEIHRYWLQQYQIQGTYELLEVKPDQFELTLQELSTLGYAGINVTVPFKEQALRLVDTVDDVASMIGAVNTVIVQKTGRLWGTNTDAYGFIQNIKHQLPGISFSHKTALVLGAGGAARAVLYGLLQEGVEQILLANRTYERAVSLQEMFGRRIQPIAWDQKEENLQSVDFLINTTLLGMEKQPPLDIHLTRLSKDAVVVDIVYRPLLTPLLIQAHAQGNKIVEGLGMLLYQAIKGFLLFYGQEPKITEELYNRMQMRLQS